MLDAVSQLRLFDDRSADIRANCTQYLGQRSHIIGGMAFLSFGAWGLDTRMGGVMSGWSKILDTRLQAGEVSGLRTSRRLGKLIATSSRVSARVDG